MDQWTSGGFHVNSSWIEAVNLIVVKKKKQKEKNSQQNSTYYDYEVATIEREGIPFVSAEEGVLERQKTATSRRRHLPAANLHEADFAAEWRPIIGHSVVERFEKSFELQNQDSFPNSAPQIFTSENITWKSAQAKVSPENSQLLMPPQLALRVAALRCLFVELGVLLVASTSDTTTSSSAIVDRWRSTVAEDPSAFLRLFQQEQQPFLRPRLSEGDNLLFEWWNWLTPTTVGRSPRYDTLFYLVVLEDENSSQCTATIKTISSNPIAWNSPDDLFSLYSRHSFLLSPTQLYELLRVSSHPWADWLRSFARQREERHGIQRWIPLVALYSDGTISYLPGDQYYPPKVDLLPSKTARMYTGISTEMMREKTLNSSKNAAVPVNQRRMNRIEHNGYWCRVVVTADEVAAGQNDDALAKEKNATDSSSFGHLSIFYHELPVNRISANGANGALQWQPNNSQLNAKL